MGLPRVETDITVNGIAYREGDAWIVQGIEYDIVAFSETLGGLAKAFTEAIVENARITQHLGRAPLEGIKPAPAHFREMFKNAQSELRPVNPPTHRRPNVTVRVAA